ncbi:hypothetical protein MJO28_016796 [Puccinia striiformis f. sp. tritici]|nr:hypothetical protein Pst134EB_026535 [Puccinia striiformis f. sp. tritici]KAI7935269.1 hypothetical protein MJO28_016796 [Puccinia striiformis f. sp. tritici]KAI7941274.1 hypothetical protein MJO29_013348 [Puccinia striiformis f. sp. tritici]
MVFSTRQIMSHISSGLLSLALCSNLLSDIPREQLFFQRSEQGPISSRPDTSNLIFASFSGLLQQWSNSMFPNGHSIIAGVIPRGTLLYHGANRRESPPEGMEWLSFDPEMAYSVHAVREGETALYTYSTQRALRIIYLDGQSAAVGTAGYMDSQSLLINRTVSKELGESGPLNILRAEYQRAEGLCELGKRFGFEGIVRMNTGFELIWCDFADGLDLIRETNTTDPFQTQDNSPAQYNPVFQIKSSPLYAEAPWESTRVATLQYHDPGESRVKLDPNTFISFYDRLDSLSEKRISLNQEHKRSMHRLYGISQEDATVLIDRLEHVISRKNSQGWEVNQNDPDWQGIVRNIIQGYSSRLMDLEDLLKDSQRNGTMKALDVRRLTYAMLMPYINFSNFSLTDFSWMEVGIKNCKISFTTVERGRENLGESSRVLMGAIEGTLERVCGTVAKMFSQAVKLDLPNSYRYNSQNNPLNDPVFEKEARDQVVGWKKELDHLMAWLGWPVWMRCQPQCSPSEICMIPMWPASRVVRIHPFEYTTPVDDEIFEAHPVPACHPWEKSKPLASLPAEKMSLTTKL